MVLVIHDYKCVCGNIVKDSNTKPDACNVCGSSKFEITYELWGSVHYIGDVNELTDSRGFRKKYTALEDPTCAIEIGLVEDKGIGTFSDEQKKYYAGKILTDGDSPQLRKEILRQRQRNLVEQGIPSPEVQ